MPLLTIEKREKKWLLCNMSLTSGTGCEFVYVSVKWIALERIALCNLTQTNIAK
jgi:hypothetical protein